MEREIIRLVINMHVYGKGKTSCMSKVLREIRNDMAECNASYNKSKQVALFFVYFDKELYMFRTHLLSITSSLNTVYIATVFCHSS
jgi:phage-related protein